MAVNPITFTRVSHNLQTLSLLDSLRRNAMALFAEQNRMASGNRLNAPSDDPVLAAQALNLTQILDRQDQILANIRHADSFLSATDNAMTEISDLLTEAKTIAADMVNSVVRADERESQAELISGIIDQLIAVGNRAYNGVQLFAGRATTTPPFERRYGGVIYVGDLGDLTTNIGGAAPATINLTGDALFGMTTGRVRGYRDLEPVATAQTRLVDLKGATELGVRKGLLRVLENGGLNDFQVDLTTADTLGDVADAITAASAAAGATVTASVVGGRLVLSSGGGFDLEVRETDNGTVAADLGILKTAPAGSDILGDNPHARITSTTLIADLAGGAGIALTDPVRITNGELSVELDLSGAVTVQDLINQIDTAGVGVRAVINEAANGLDVINLISGVELRITEVGGGSSADNLGLRTLHADLELAQLNHGRGVETAGGPADFRIVSRDGKTVDVSVAGAVTVQDVLDLINAAAVSAGAAITASLNPDGPGIRIDDASGGGGLLQVQRLNGSYAIDDLGLNKTAPAGQDYLISDDVAGVRAASVFSALLDLEAALRADDTRAINLAGQELEGWAPQMARLRGIVGARSKAMRDRLTFTEDAVEATRVLLSEVKDLDYTEAVTKFQQAQTALQANLLTGSRMLNISLLDFLS